MRIWWRPVALLALGASSCIGLPPDPPGQLETTGSPTTTASTTTTSTTTTSTTPPDPEDSTTSTTSPADSTSSTGDASTGDSSSSGEPAPTLVDEGVLARWYIDEVEQGQGSAQVLDAVEPPLDLPMDYFGAMPTYQLDAGNRGLYWLDIAQDGGPSVSLDGTKIYAGLIGSAQVTIELTLNVEQLHQYRSRFFHTGINNNLGQLTIAARQLDELDVIWDGQVVATFLMPTLVRQVIHVVIDTEQGLTNQVQAYSDGVQLPVLEALTLPGGETVAFTNETELALGNRATGGRSFQGHLGYAAIYARALTTEEVVHNAQILQQSDDQP